jgi:iron complex transport system permease protein
MKSYPAVIAITVLITLFAAVLSLLFGSTSIGPAELWRGLFEGGTANVVLFEVRLPRLIFALGVGGILGVAGAIFQTLLRNPLADPYILGISGGAALGATVVMSLTTSLAHVGALVGAACVVAIIALVARWSRGRGAEYAVLLTGVMVNAFCGAVILTIRSLISAQKSQEILFFLIGTLDVEDSSLFDFGAIGVALAVILGAGLVYARPLDLLALGTEEAKALGVDAVALRMRLIILVSACVAIVIPYIGLIGFVGLVAPHFVRLLIGPQHIRLLPLVALTGGAFLTFADVIARVSFHSFNSTLPVGAVTALIGAPVFLWFLRAALAEQG